MQYFKQTLPEDGAKSGNPHSENEAEWIVNLTTRVRIQAWDCCSLNAMSASPRCGLCAVCPVL